MQVGISNIAEAMASFRGYQCRVTRTHLNPFIFHPDLRFARQHRQDFLDWMPMGWSSEPWSAPLLENRKRGSAGQGRDAHARRDPGTPVVSVLTIVIDQIHGNTPLRRIDLGCSIPPSP